jgi:hypothetical protein
MDKVTRGMSEAGRHPNECCHKPAARESLLHRMAHSFKGIAQNVRHFLGRGRMPAAR